MGRKGQRRGSYADVLGQSDHPLVGFDPWGGLVQQAGRRLALGQRPQVCEVCGLTTELPGAWLLVPHIPLQVALVKLLKVLGEPLVVGQAGRVHRGDGLHPIGAVVATMVTCSKAGPRSGQTGTRSQAALPGPPGPPALAGPPPAPPPQAAAGDLGG